MTSHALLLALNAGSGTVKAALFTSTPEPQELHRETAVIHDEGTAVAAAVSMVRGFTAGRSLAAIGHRIVHGGPTYRTPVPIDAAVIAELKRLVPFAPNHLPAAIALIDVFQKAWPDIPHVACFDTGFHATMALASRRLPIPDRYDAAGIRRYGFHGLSCTHVIDALRRNNGDAAAEARLAIAHLGNGSSVTATRAGASVDTTMGLTPLGGVIMATRTGDIDPGALVFIARQDGMSVDRVEEFCSREGGLEAVSGVTADMRELLAREASDSRCALAIEMYVLSVAKAIAAAAAVLGGLDGIVFTGGIGEHAEPIRRRVLERLAFLDAWVRVIPADEERVIAAACVAILNGAA
jgi:acetate kinase